jgi:hypothetical protein
MQARFTLTGYPEEAAGAGRPRSFGEVITMTATQRPRAQCSGWVMTATRHVAHDRCLHAELARAASHDPDGLGAGKEAEVKSARARCRSP